MSSLSRRQFVQMGGAAVGGSAVASGLTTRWWGLDRDPVPDPGTEGDRVVSTFCELCFWGCGAESKAQSTLKESREAPIYTFLPALIKGAGITIIISVSSMALAIILGLMLAIMRLYGGPLLRKSAVFYIEMYRGTPLLIQLYILYYGLPNIGISLSPFLAAFLGLGMNYAAYESEIYRAGINALPRGQTEAALSLGMSRPLALRRIVLP